MSREFLNNLSNHTTANDFDSQFSWSWERWLKGLDFPTWYKYSFLIKEIICKNPGPENVLEIGTGSRIMQNILSDKIRNYVTMDINPDLHPDIVDDLRNSNPSLSGKFDCVICADVLEHMPFEDLKLNLENIFKYLTKDGEALITIPHRRKEIMIISSFSVYKTFFISLPIWITPRGFYQWFVKNRVGIDPYHCWEIGDRKINTASVENVIKAVGFEISKFMKLPYVDFWVLERS